MRERSHAMLLLPPLRAQGRVSVGERELTSACCRTCELKSATRVSRLNLKGVRERERAIAGKDATVTSAASCVCVCGWLCPRVVGVAQSQVNCELKVRK